jgi:hypothetical protein
VFCGRFVIGDWWRLEGRSIVGSRSKTTPPQPRQLRPQPIPRGSPTPPYSNSCSPEADRSSGFPMGQLPYPAPRDAICVGIGSALRPFDETRWFLWGGPFASVRRQGLKQSPAPAQPRPDQGQATWLAVLTGRKTNPTTMHDDDASRTSRCLPSNRYRRGMGEGWKMKGSTP